MASLIEDYALIGDCKSAALVAKNGSIDWLCLPRFDSPAFFASILGNKEHGRWLIAPVDGDFTVKRRYIEGTLILETEFHGENGAVRLTDFMPPQTGTADVIRIVHGISGEVQLNSELIVRFDYGSTSPWIRLIDRGVRLTAGPDSVRIFCDVRQAVEGEAVVCAFTVAQGQTVAFQLTHTETYGPEPLERNVVQSLKDTTACWREWSDRCTYNGLWKREVIRSLITLKGLTYAPSGGIVAAPTTSLPEHIGGSRNWDYRFCWIRDATFTLLSFLVGGYVEEARAWRQWLVNAAAGNPSQLQIMYGITGKRRLTELELDWLPGYEGSRPVRTGNGAYCQHQLDVPGEIMETLHIARRHGLSTSDEAWQVQLAVMEGLESRWDQPDEGIWEIRGQRRHFTHSKVMAWVAADRAVKDVEQFGLRGDATRWRTLRDRIHKQVCAEGYNEQLGAFVQYYGSEEPDASLLMLPLVGFIDAKDPRMTGTIHLIERRLVNNGLVERYASESHVDGLPVGEGAFLLCSFWLADNYALAGRQDEARELFQMLLGLRNDVGLLSEEYDTSKKRMLGNFPQAFSHVGLVNTARNLTCEGGPAEERCSE